MSSKYEDIVFVLYGIKWWMNKKYIRDFFSDFGKVMEIYIEPALSGNSYDRKSYVQMRLKHRFSKVSEALEKATFNNQKPQFDIQREMPQFYKPQHGSSQEVLRGIKAPFLFEDERCLIPLCPEDFEDGVIPLYHTGIRPQEAQEQLDEIKSNEKAIEELEFIDRKPTLESTPSGVTMRPLMEDTPRPIQQTVQKQSKHKHHQSHSHETQTPPAQPSPARTQSQSRPPAPQQQTAPPPPPPPPMSRLQQGPSAQPVPQRAPAMAAGRMQGASGHGAAPPPPPVPPPPPGRAIAPMQQIQAAMQAVGSKIQMPMQGSIDDHGEHQAKPKRPPPPPRPPMIPGMFPPMLSGMMRQPMMPGMQPPGMMRQPMIPGMQPPGMFPPGMRAPPPPFMDHPPMQFFQDRPPRDRDRGFDERRDRGFDERRERGFDDRRDMERDYGYDDRHGGYDDRRDKGRSYDDRRNYDDRRYDDRRGPPPQDRMHRGYDGRRH